MASLIAIGFTAVAGTCGFVVSMISFGFAMSKQSTCIAARCIARPKTVIYNPNPADACQNRGNIFWGWVPWVMKLTYATMLSGVPGTGTRDGGLSGLMLKVNLDGIVLIRFHHLCLRVSSLAAILYILIVLPVFKTAQCSIIEGDNSDSARCLNQNTTNYERFTIANVPSLSDNTVDNAGVKVRLYAVVIVSCIITWYTYVLLETEWRDILALRRVYFLEADHWSDRNAELEETLLREEREKSKELTKDTDFDVESAKNYAKTRDPWVHHPEQRDTVPNIELYSVLVGGLPSLPTEAFLQEDVKAVFSRKQSIDWQLAVTSAFFDHCVPNQPGFSSSVAAVTILPAASQITKAWKHWYNTAAKVRRLRFIRKQISRKRKDIDESRNNSNHGFGDKHVDQQLNRSFYRKKKKTHKKKRTIKRPSSVYTESDEKKKYYSEVLGNTDDLDVEKNLLHALKLGPEQTAVYSREFAQGAANIAPYGWNESKIRNSSIPELLEMEKNAVTAVQEASHGLRKAQETIIENDFNGKPCNDEDLTELMVSATTTTKNNSADHDSEVHREIANSNQRTTKEDISKRSTFRESWLNFTTRMVDVVADDVSTSQSTTCNTLDGSRSTRRSLLQNLEVISPTVDQSKRLSSQSSENKTPIAQGLFPGGRISLGKNTQSRNRNSSTGLDYLGLEAGLFLEHTQHMPRNLLTRTKSAEDISKLYKDEYEIISPIPVQNDREHSRTDRKHRRAKSTDDNNILLLEISVSSECNTEEAELDSSSLERVVQGKKKSYTIAAPPFTNSEDKGRDKLEFERLGYEPTESDHTGHDTETGMTSRTDSIWDKIASENDRRSKIRKRLDRISIANDEEKLAETKHISFSDAKAIIITDGKPNNNCSLNNGVSILKADNISHRHTTDTRMFSIDESSNKSYKLLESDALSASARTGIGSMHHLDCSGKDISSYMIDEDVRLAYAFEEKAGLRRRQGNTTVDRLSKTTNEKWSKIIQIVNESSSRRNKDDEGDPIESGSYSVCAFCSICDRITVILKNTFNLSKWQNRSAELVDPFDLAGESTFAVVTFTSRQAAVAARYCLADSRGADRWNTVSEIPSPPLADASVCNLSSFVRPVTISINDRQKMIRHNLALAILGAIYIFYISPLSWVRQSLSSESFTGITPRLDAWLENDFAKYIFSGFIPALVWNGFYAICPPMFKAIANFGSNATSAACAEGSALRYFWWFMIVSAFTGTSLKVAVVDGLPKFGLSLNSTYQVIKDVAIAIPTESATWLNWIIVRVSLALPTQYILQMNVFLLSWLRLKALARALQGGGSGGPIPFRIYVDAGVVMLCLLALAPASPLIAIAAFVYFLFCVPMLRWVLIFLYKPKFDIGGARFPFIFDMCVSGMIAGQILLVAMLKNKNAPGPAIVAFFPLIPIIYYRWILLKRYLKAFTDVALLQTSLLDGWDTNEESCGSKREEFRQFLVDCHKAAYVPVCIASDEATVITSEPAVVVQLETDANEDDDDTMSVNTESHSMRSLDIESLDVTNRASEHQTLYHPYQSNKQLGRMMRRASGHGSSFFTSSTSLVDDSILTPKKKKLYVTKPTI